MKKILNHVEEYVASIVFVIMLSITFINVVFRYFASASISFTEEITGALFVLLCLMGTAIAAKNQEHLGLSLLTEFMSDKKSQLVFMIGNLLAVVFSIILMITGIEMVIHEYEIKQLSIALQWPEWIYGSFLPIGAFFVAVRFFQAALNNIKAYRRADRI